MKILVDENIPFAEESFGQHGELVRFHGRQLRPEMLAGADALITRSITRVNAELFSCAQPEFVGSCTIGTDHLDISYLQAQGIVWTAAPGCNAQSVVDYVLSVLAAVRGAQLPATAGIVGCGNVGGRLRERLLALGVDLRVYDPFLSVADVPELVDSLPQAMSAEVVCVHTPLTQAGESDFPSEKMIRRPQLDCLPANAILLNAGRGGVIDEADLLAFMQDRPDVTVVLDVWQNEPRPNPQLMSQVAVATPHIAGYSMEGKLRGTEQVYASFCRFFRLQPTALDVLPPVRLSLQSQSVAELLLQVYDPRADMYRMRNAAELAPEKDRDSGAWFDELRKNYPQRREIASFQIDGEVAPELANLGFRQAQAPG